MRLLDRYVLREYLLNLTYVVVGFCMLEIVADLFNNFSQFVQAKISLGLLLRYYAGFLSAMLEFLMPAALLLATLYTLWQMARHGELTAMRASGVSFYRIALPILGIGLLCSILVAAIKEEIAPAAIRWSKDFDRNDFKEVKQQIFFKVYYYGTEGRRMWWMDELDMEGATATAKAVTLTQERPDGSVAEKLFATKGHWLDGQWWFYDVQKLAHNEQGNPIGQMKPVAGSAHGFEMRQVKESPADFCSEIYDWDVLPAKVKRRYLRTHPALSAEARVQKRVDVHKRMAMPWACFVVTLFAIPAGARSAREGVMAGVLLTLLCFFAFYLFMQVGVLLGKAQVVPPWAGAWLPNIAFLIAGTGMLFKNR